MLCLEVILLGRIAPAASAYILPPQMPSKLNEVSVLCMVFQQLFEPDKAARLISFADRQQSALTLPETIEMCAQKVWGTTAQGAMNKSLQRQTQRVFVEELMTLGA